MYGGQMYAARSSACPSCPIHVSWRGNPTRRENAFNIHGHFQQTAMYRVNLLIYHQTEVNKLIRGVTPSLRTRQTGTHILILLSHYLEDRVPDRPEQIGLL